MEKYTLGAMRCLRRPLVFASWIVVLGCSGDKYEARVSGTVTLDGEAIGPGSIVFAPVEAEHNPAQGAIQPNGSYSLKTANDLGLQPGKYRVSLSIVELPTDLQPGERDMRPTVSRIPEKYTKVETSGLEYEVEPGRNRINIPLTSEAE